MLIRKATLKDSEAIARHLLLAMEEIVYKFIGSKDTEKARQFMLHFAGRDNNQYSYQNCWVVQDENDIVATINVYDGAALHQFRQPVLEYLKTMYNKDLKPDGEAQDGDDDSDSLGVSADRQCRGIGSMLVNRIVDEDTKGGETLGLLVDDENPNARRFYIRLGFKSVGE